MEIRSYTKDTIGELLLSPGFTWWKNIPITKHRALSQIHNPRISSTDKILFVAFDGDEVAGYLGVLGDLIFMDDMPLRVGWLSCFYVDPVYRGKHIAMELFSQVMEAWDNTIFITNMAPETIGFYNKTGLFHEPVFKQGIRGFLRFNLAEILPPKRNIFKRCIPLLKVIDAVLNIGNSLRLLFYTRYTQSENVRIEYLREITPETEKFVLRMNKNEWIKRGKAEWEWIVSYPWLLQAQEKDPESKRYFFSSVARRFFYRCVQLYDGKNNIIAFILLSVRNEHLTVPYYYCDRGYHPEVAKFLINTMRDENISMITVFHTDLSETLRTMNTPFIVKRSIQRPYLFPKGIDISDLNFQDGDGDSVFT
ncbi:MAG: GNAT family N-acetyltransferase [Bacteroidetes bacterium]|nr:GNAT family N-acetyltransferase [Bacteroidota bacterium]